MKKTVLVTIVFLVLIALFVCFHIRSKKVDTEYAIEYAKTFGSYDIKKVDQYLKEDTRITYNEKTDTYKNLRDNVIAAFDEKQYTMASDSSYGHGNDTFADGIQTIGIQTYVDSKLYSSEYVSMELKRKWLVFYEVESISSSDDFFGYLFFRIKKQ